MRECFTKTDPTILVVDDEPVVVALLNAALKGQGFTVLPASGGEMAVELYRKLGQDIDLVLLDVRMPGMDGLATLAALRALNPAVLACFMTGDTGTYTGEELLQAGAATVFLKPFKLEALVQTLHDLLEGWNMPLGWPEPAPGKVKSSAPLPRHIPSIQAAELGRGCPGPAFVDHEVRPDGGDRYNPHRAGPRHQG